MEDQHKQHTPNQDSCCKQADEIYTGAGQLIDQGGCCSPGAKKVHSHHEDDGHEHQHNQGNKTTFQLFLPAMLSFVLLLLAIALDNWIAQGWFTGWLRVIW